MTREEALKCLEQEGYKSPQKPFLLISGHPQYGDSANWFTTEQDMNETITEITAQGYEIYAKLEIGYAREM